MQRPGLGSLLSGPGSCRASAASRARSEADRDTAVERVGARPHPFTLSSAVGLHRVPEVSNAMSDRLIVTGMTMTLAHSLHRSPWIALAAFLVALSATGEARACTTMVEGSGACATVCGCCKSPALGGSVSDTVVAEAAQRLAPAQADEVCDSLPRGGCACRSGQPEAPEPKAGQRTTGGETDFGRALAQGESAHDVSPRSLTRPTWATESPPQRSPLYLRNSRLLI